MIQVNRIVDGIALSVAAAAFGLVGCGADPTPSGPSGQTPVVQPQGGAPSTAAAAGTGAVMTAPGGGTGSKPAAAGSGPVVTVPNAGTAALPAAGTGASSGTAGTGSQAPRTDVTWTPEAALDATGNLKPPAAGEGFQIATPTFELQPGQELFKCFHVAVPTDVEFPVGEWDAQMSPGSHHFILYRSPSDTSATEAGMLTDRGCTQGFGGNSWLYTQGAPRGHLKFPDGVAMMLTAKEKINFDMHYINTGTTTIKARVVLNINKVKGEKFQKADAQISFNFGIAVPAHGTQTVKGECTPVPGGKYFLMQTHTHKYATLALIQRKLASGTMGEELVRTTDWDSPDVVEWGAPNFLTFQPGEKIAYKCDYKNDTNATVTVGTSAEVNEMCMAEAYYFPQAASTPACN